MANCKPQPMKLSKSLPMPKFSIVIEPLEIPYEEDYLDLPSHDEILGVLNIEKNWSSSDEESTEEKGDIENEKGTQEEEDTIRKKDRYLFRLLPPNPKCSSNNSGKEHNNVVTHFCTRINEKKQTQA